ncbi:uncharacterized protein [Mytilus edulis]|uniref:uncharacterized protein n=1 Tax=Mytilus edulis TaxID=6550 RepID=UPI0039EF76A2
MRLLLAISLLVTGTLSAVTDHQFETLAKKVEDLTRQLMLTELSIGERARSDADSGIKQIRTTNDGTKSYFTQTHSYNSVCSIHEHSNYDRTVGMGEFIANMNGVEFRTRHNDYKLRMPSKTSKNYNQQDEIPFPAVPPSVLAKPNLQEQVHEMQNYFRAFAFQNHNFRDYRPYFKPVLCYLEGTWTTSTKSIDEPFQSDRHSIDAESWFDLQEKIRFTSYTGGKHYLENFSYLPTTIMNMINGTPEYAQWNYRISCHPLSFDLPLSAMKPVDDMAGRIGHKMNLTRYAHTRAARFSFARRFGRENHFQWEDGFGNFKDAAYHNGVLDKIMNEIPGKDNYGAVLHDNTFGMDTLDPRKVNATLLNTAYYHRRFKHDRKGAMGIRDVHRGFSDSNLFVAQTSNPKVAPMKIHYCAKNEHTHHKECKTEAVRYSYAIPLEIIYLTPLFSWNPHNLKYVDRRDRRGQAVIVEGGKRNGGTTVDKAYNGTSYKLFYKTPVEFFHGTNVDKDKADTDRGAVGVLDKHGALKKVVSSGQRITLPDIPGVGKLRLRYPVMPVTREGNQIGKELDAVKDVLNHLKNLGGYLDQKPSALAGAGITQADSHFRTSVTNQDPPGHHFHEFYIDYEDMQDLAKGLTVTVGTTTDNSHSHQLEISFDANTHTYKIHKCDGQAKCWDGHSADLYSLD